MDLFKSSSNKLSQNDVILIIVLILFISFDIQVPMMVSSFVEGNMLVQAGLYILALSTLLKGNFIVGLLSIVAVQIFIQRSKTSYAIKKYVPSEENKFDELINFNDSNQVSLEEEMVSKMAPIVSSENSGPASYLPILDNDAGAFQLDTEGLI
jgi:hypothetical protein